MRTALVFLGLLAATAASAAECRQDRAIYADRDGGYELTFEPVGSSAAATSHHFKLTVLSSKTVLDGIVMPGDDPVRSNGMVMHNCPEGDVTGEEIAACTVWEGVIYTLDGAGDAAVLPEEGAKAAETLLLAGFGPSLRYSSLWDEGKAKVAPWDVFKRKGCAA